MMKVFRKFILLFLCLLLLFVIAPNQLVQAQLYEGRIYFSPDPSYIYMDGSNRVAIDIKIEDVTLINAFDVEVTFDPSKVSIHSWQTGNFLDNYSCFKQEQRDDSLWLACVQLGGSGHTGGGVLFRMIFNGVAEGITALQFTRAELAKTDTQLVLPEKSHGTLNVVNTGNLLYLPLILNIAKQGQTNRGGIMLSLGRGLHYGLAYSGVSTNIPGENLTIPSVAADTYLLTTNEPRVLNITADLNKTATITSGDGTLTPLVLRGGNAVWTDNVIDIHDLTLVNGGYLDPGANPNADVNFDGMVNLMDAAIVAGNYGLSSQTAYVTWVP